MATNTIRKWVWGSEGSDKRVCGRFLPIDLNKTAWLVIPKGSYIQSVIVWTKGKAHHRGRVRVDLNGEQIFDKIDAWNAFEWEDTVDVTGNIHPPPPEWGNGRNEVHVNFTVDPIFETCYDFRLYIEAVVFTPPPDDEEPPPDDGEQPHWQDDEGNGKALTLCTIAFLFGATSLTKLFPILRMFRDQFLPSIIVEGYYRLGYILLHGWCKSECG